MLSRIKLFIIHIIDIIDSVILDHRFRWLCEKSLMSNWWGDHDCGSDVNCYLNKKPNG